MSQQWQTLTNLDGQRTPLLTRYRETPLATILVLPALGTAAGFYARLTDGLYTAGFGSAVLEMRGQGRSPLRAGRRCDWGFRELLTQDIPAAIETLRATARDVPLYLCGHSLGGHLAVATAALAPQTFDGAVLAACGSPWSGAFDGRTRRQIRLLCALLPALNALLGFFPGKQIGFGGREARTLMADWRSLALRDRYSVHGMTADLEAGIAAYRGRVLTLRLADDTLAPARAVQRVTDRLRAAHLTIETIDSESLGRRADHFGWCRQPTEVAARIRAWHLEHCAG